MKNDQKGFSVVEIILVVVIVGLIGAVGWLVHDRQKTKTTNSDISKTTAQQATKTTKTNEAAKVDPNAGYLVVKEWGLRFKSPSGLTDVRYVIHGDTADFYAKPTGSSVQYRTDYDKYENGGARYAIGTLYRSTSSTKVYAGNLTREGKKLGNYYYYTGWAFSSLATGAACTGLYGDDESSCQIEAMAFQLVNQGDSALLNTIELAQ